ncbi:MAG: HlyD family efflux transporter periplasmic adaptor subunit [Clostridia bacterium]|nr:hypothetical protein [Eubacteriaceae bacterium]MDD6476502.1 HlyD family efflux transporter periplasmic adaptor subunit [Eubacteriales bacterium]MDY3038007.1 HlyD family efflux transporter periplasmic adaptor subunit [Eubacteriales bacterium]
MKIKLSKKTKKAISVYIAALLILYIVVEVLPKVTDIFETTQVLEPGTLKVSYETKGYFIKDEYIGIAPESGKVQYLVGKGTAVKKGHPVVSVEAGEKSSKESRFSKYTDRLKGYEGLSEDYNAPISGVFSLTIDGYEEYFSIGNLDKIERDKVEQLSYGSVSLERDSVIKGEPVYKISADDKWYVLCWVGKDVVESYSEGREVSLELPEGTVDATVYSVKKDGSDYRVVFYLDVYYKAFCESRAEDMSIVTSDNEGLIVYNKCIVEKDGNKGVYVKDKNGAYIFTRVKIISSDDKKSVLETSTFYDDEGNQVYTVDVYDEVLKHPAGALKEDQKKENSENGG